MTVKKYLSLKPVYYKKMDYGRMPRIYTKYKDKFPQNKIIHIIGTNGKGSTGRWLALMLQKAGFKVGHFTSPHLLEYNERFWLDGQNIPYENLDLIHNKLINIMEKDDFDCLSYFEYSTFLAYLAFEDCDYVIFEAGLGGEYDATSVFPKMLSLVTSISYDHTDLLGKDIKSIAITKIKSVESDFIISYKNEKKVLKIANKIANMKNVKLIKTDKKDLKCLKEYAKKYNYPKFLLSNLLTAKYALQYLHEEVDLTSLPPLDLKGRCEKIGENIFVDVGHNPLSAKVLAKNFKKKSVILVYNSFADKDIKSILDIILPIAKKILIFPFKVDGRKTGDKKIKKILKKRNIKFKYFDFNIDQKEKYLIFGSFKVAENFLRRIHAK